MSTGPDARKQKVSASLPRDIWGCAIDPRAAQWLQMVDDTFESRFRARPREDLGVIADPAPARYLRDDELLEYALPAFWGEGFPGKNIEIALEEIGAGTIAWRAIEVGKIVGAGRHIIEALRAEKLTLVAVETSRAEDPLFDTPRIPASDWNDVQVEEVFADFIRGEGEGLKPHLPRWITGKRLLVTTADASAWLNTLEARARLPRIVGRDPAPLRPEYVTAWEAISWLAGQEVRDWYGVTEAAAGIRDLCEAISAYDSQKPWDSEFYELAARFTELLADRDKREHASRELRRAMASGDLVGYGIPSGNELAGLKPIPPQEFLVSRSFMAFEDTLLVESEPASEQGTTAGVQSWKQVRFLRRDLVARWGPEDEEFELPGSKRIPSGKVLRILKPNTAPKISRTIKRPDMSTERRTQQPRGRRAKYDWKGLESYLDKLWAYHGGLEEADPEFGRQADIEKAARGWFIDRSGDCPAESTIRLRVSGWLGSVAQIG